MPNPMLYSLYINTLKTAAISMKPIPSDAGTAKSFEAPAKIPYPLTAVVLDSTPILQGRNKSLHELTLALFNASHCEQSTIKLYASQAFPIGSAFVLSQTQQGTPYIDPILTQKQLPELIQLTLTHWQAKLAQVNPPQEKSPLTLSTTELNRLFESYPTLKPELNFLIQRPALNHRAELKHWIQQFQNINQTLHQESTLDAVQQRQQEQTAQASMISKVFKTHDTQNTAWTSTTTTTTTTTTSTEQSLKGQSQLHAPKALKEALKGQSLQPSIEPSREKSPNSIPLHAPAKTHNQSLQKPIPLTPNIQSNVVNEHKPLNSPTKGSATGAIVSLESSTRESLISTHAKPQSSLIVDKDTPNRVFKNQDLDSSTTQKNTQKGASAPLLSELAFQKTQVGLSQASLLPSRGAVGKTINHQTHTHTTATRDPGVLTLELQKLPIEFRLGAGLNAMNQMIAHSPQLSSRLLQNQPYSISHIELKNTLHAKTIRLQNSKASEADQAASQDTLLKLHSLLLTTLTKVQQSAVHSALSAWQSTDETIQHLNIPIFRQDHIHWVAIEWWQEQKSASHHTSSEKPERIYRIRLFLTLSPLADICSEVVFGSAEPEVIFWSEDNATLQHLNHYLPKLEQWTQGLGQTQVRVCHGLPKRKTPNLQNHSQNLVDIRT